MAKQSGGLLLYRIKDNDVQLLLVHPGGPYWAKKEEHAWSIPKGEVEETEDLMAAAKREFQEETGWSAPSGTLHSLGSLKVPGGKVNHIWAIESDLDAGSIKSNTLELEWPPRIGQQIEVPEVDKAHWVSLSQAKQKLHKGQCEFVDRLKDMLRREKPTLRFKDEDQDFSASQVSLF